MNLLNVAAWDRCYDFYNIFGTTTEKQKHDHNISFEDKHRFFAKNWHESPLKSDLNFDPWVEKKFFFLFKASRKSCYVRLCTSSNDIYIYSLNFSIYSDKIICNFQNDSRQIVLTA
jgi:hypothetical protein